MTRDRASFTGAPDPYHKPAADHRAIEQKKHRRQAWHRALCDEAAQHHAWVLTTAGSDRTIIEALKTSAFPSMLLAREYPLQDEPPGERILPFQTSTPMTLSASGALIPATAESTRPVTMTHYGAGPTRTARFSFKTPH
jgi:hypothetical protein